MEMSNLLFFFKYSREEGRPMRGDVVFVNFKNILEKKDDLCEEISSLLNLKEN